MAESPHPGPRPPTALKVVVTGPYGAGKTTLIQTLSDRVVARSERLISLDHDDADPATLAVDVGHMTIDELDVELLGTAGHPALEPLWAVVGDGILGVVIMVDDTRPDSFDEVAEVIAEVDESTDLPWILAVNKVLRGREELAARRAHHQLRLRDEVRVVAGDARDADSARDILVELFEAVRDRLLDAADPADRTTAGDGAGRA